MKKNLFLLACLLLALTACRDLDDDSEYAPFTEAGYFLCLDTNGIEYVIIRVDSGGVVTRWSNEQSLGQITDMKGKGEDLYVASREANFIFHYDLVSGTIKEEWGYLPIRPDFICPGEKYLFISDSLDDQVGFLKLKNGDLVTQNVTGNPGRVTYNNGKFYVDVNGAVTIFSETALTDYYSTPAVGDIIDLNVDGLRSLQALSADSAGFYNLTIDGNGDILVAGPTAVSWRSARYSPWINQQFGSEFLENIYLNGTQLSLTTIPDSADAFEVDFFESKLYAHWADSLRIRSLPGGSLIRSVYFPWMPLRAFFHIGNGL